jgi:hypothetical protein
MELGGKQLIIDEAFGNSNTVETSKPVIEVPAYQSRISNSL